MTCIVIDDEEFAIQHLEDLIRKVPYLELKGSFPDPSEAIVYLQENPVDLIFVDAEMPNHAINGIDFIKIVGQFQKYVLTTAYPQYALQGYDLDVVDFLHKPFGFDRFLKAVQKAQTSLEPVEKPFLVQPRESFIYVKSEGNLIAAYFDEICWIETAPERNYIHILTQNDRLTSHLSLTDIESQLPNTLFSRIHKSYIVDRTKIRVVNKEKNTVSILRQGELKELPVGESYRKSLYQLIDKKVVRKDGK
ncbi:response regulator [Spirosoma sp. HMF3257]|uniref:DNA-binding response regulator n=1 Tax=Spirosoma telluris TaxID=2183553 RepID=A0A327ND03_9BACT|nr:response regulator [Spirosoma telluris]RAI73140.1 DNA-binding response regulator [Spirosoma telluris]